MSDETLRLFVAIELPETWLAALSTYQARVRAATGQGRGISWSRPEGFHVSLKFIGAFDQPRLPQLLDTLVSATPPALDYRIQLAGTFLFGGRPIPRIFAARYTAPAHMTMLEALASRLDRSLVPLGVARESRRLLPHITLARLRPDIAPDMVQAFHDAMHAVPQPKAPPFTARRLSLMRSHLGPGGARYERLASFPPEA